MTDTPSVPGDDSGGAQQAPPPAGAWQAPPPPAGGWGPPPAAGSGPGGGGAVNWSPPPVAAGPAAGVAYAGFVIRLVAYIVDGIILLIPNAILGIIFLAGAVSVSVSSSGARVGVDYGPLLLVTILELAISAAYFVYTWTRMRASPGDRAFGLMVVNAADGSPLTMNQALIRWAVLAGPSALSSLITAGTGGLGALVGLLVFFWYVYLAWTTATDPRRQGFHDKYVGSVVVKATLV